MNATILRFILIAGLVTPYVGFAGCGASTEVKSFKAPQEESGASVPLDDFGRQQQELSRDRVSTAESGDLQGLEGCLKGVQELLYDAVIASNNLNDAADGNDGSQAARVEELRSISAESATVDYGNETVQPAPEVEQWRQERDQQRKALRADKHRRAIEKSLKNWSAVKEIVQRKGDRKGGGGATRPNTPAQN